MSSTFNPSVRQYAFKIHAYKRLPNEVIQNMELSQLEFLEECLKPYLPSEYMQWFNDHGFNEWFFSGDATEAMFLRAQRRSMELLGNILDDSELPDLEKLPAIKTVLALSAAQAKQKPVVAHSKELKAIPDKKFKELAKKSENDLIDEINALKEGSG